ncbi:sulfite exporter TauE/SafE family protein [Halobacteriovorax marinus]|uniref:sulfite exporter TauE/SafE family protein n=1 Tax=Halobacteriovorax marinus TaxID=97084 RepID=UPI003A912425
MLILGLIVTGIFVGLLSTFFGVGGGILIVPTLYTFFSFLPAQVVIATSLTLIFFNSTRNTYNFSKAGVKPNFKFVAPIALAMLIGVIFGGRLALTLDAKTIKLIFSIFVFIIAIRNIFNKNKVADHNNWSPKFTFTTISLGTLTGLVGGLISGLTGLGGGAVLIPLFILILDIPFKKLSVHSNACMVVGTFTGMLTYLIQPTPTFVFNYRILEMGQVGYVNFSIVIALFIGSSLSSKLGVILTQKVSPQVANMLFSILLIVISIKTFVSSQLF